MPDGGLNVTPADVLPAPTELSQAGQPAGLEGFAVVVWSIPSAFFHVTVVPDAIVSEVGANVVFTMQTWVAVGVHPPPEPDP